MSDLYIGLMSGTSMDAIDAVLVDFDTGRCTLHATHSVALPEWLQTRVRALTTTEAQDGIGELGHLDRELGQLFAQAAIELLQRSGVEATQVLAIGSHGQTVRHCPDEAPGYTSQIGDPNTIAELTGITTVADFRRRDIAAGGQGAPLVPPFHAAQFRTDTENRVVLNLGGIANVTLLPKSAADPATGFDTGPGNTLLDSWYRREQGGGFDAAGAWAATGKVNETLLSRLLDEPYFQRPPPKSTGAELFNLNWLDKHLHRSAGALPPADVQATLAELTARSVTKAIKRYAPQTQRVLVCGGGFRNMDLLGRLRSQLPPISVESTAIGGLDPQWVEAAAFAWLACRTLARQSGNLPAVTGATRAVILGGIYYA